MIITYIIFVVAGIILGLALASAIDGNWRTAFQQFVLSLLPLSIAISHLINV